MVITKTPFRISFFGGGTDFPDFYKEHGGAVISTSFDKYCYVTARHLPPFFEYKNELIYSRIERVTTPDEIEHPAIREAIKWLDMREIRVTYEADLPARTGLGTSSSFAVGLLSAFRCIKGKYVDKRRLAEDAIYLERVLCNECGGIQDQIAAAYGGLNLIYFNADGFQVHPIIMREERKQELQDNLLLFFTGFSRFSSDVQVAYQQALKDKTSELLEILSLVGTAHEILTGDQSLSEFGRLLDHTWKLKRGITQKISSDSIDSLYQKAINAGAVGGKLLGAGGGGFMLFYVEHDARESVRQALDGLLEVPFEFESTGTSISYYVPEVFNIEGYPI